MLRSSLVTNICSTDNAKHEQVKNKKQAARPGARGGGGWRLSKCCAQLSTSA